MQTGDRGVGGSIVAIARGRQRGCAGLRVTEVRKQVRDEEASWPTAAGAKTGGAPNPPGLPEVFGPFILTKRLGSGGVAEVFRGYYADDPTQSPVAIKRLIRPSAEGVAALLEEARVSSMLESRYIVRVIEQTRVNNRPCLVMEYVDGLDLGALIRRVRYRQQAFPSEVILGILLELARAIQVAHGHRNPETGKREPIVHFDLKPSNVLVSRDGQVKISDFGVARAKEVADIEQGVALVGTLAYMAPERVMLHREASVDHRVDLFAIGAIGYEMCTLRTLFHGSQARMIQQLLNADTYVPQALETIPDHVHPELVGIIAQLVEPDPANRYQKAMDLIRDLEALRDKLKLPADIAHFVGPYLAMDVIEEGEDRVTAHLPGEQEDRVKVLQESAGPITHLTAQQLTELLRRPVETMADPGILARQREERRKLWVIGTLVVLLVIGATAIVIRAALPVPITITTEPDNALVSVQPGCEGPVTMLVPRHYNNPVSKLQPSPFVYHTRGPWPVCFHIQAPGYVPVVEQVYQPSFVRRAKNLDVRLVKEVCVDVDSKPKGLPIYISNIYRGTTGNSPVHICGFEPGVPYYVQLEYRGHRWDIREVNGTAGQTVSAYHDFGGKVTARATAMQRCRRYFRARNWKRAVEICRVAVTQAADHAERVEALVTEGRAFIEKGEHDSGCDVLHSALDTAVSYRDLDLERQVLDWRDKYACDLSVPLPEASRKRAERKKRLQEARSASAPQTEAPNPAEEAAKAAEAAAEAAQNSTKSGEEGTTEENGEVVR